MKKKHAISIPAPPWKNRSFVTDEKTGRRIPEPQPVGKHARGLHRKGRHKRIAERAVKKTELVQESCRQANRIAQQRELKRAYAEFYATREGKEFAKQFGKSFGDAAPRCNGANRAAAGTIDFHDPADLPQASVIDHPVDHLEPAPVHVDLAGLDRDEIDLICETFKHAFRWALDGIDLVEKGKRANIAIARMRPHSANGLNIDPKLAAKFDRAFKKDTLHKTGAWFGPILEWLRRGDPVSARGERVYLLAYVLWPSAIDAQTLATLGSMTGKTRQAKDKLANCLRDTFSSLKALAMRNDITRRRCRISQLELT